MFEWLFGKQSDIDILGDMKKSNPNYNSKETPINNKQVEAFDVRNMDCYKLYFHPRVNQYFFMSEFNSDYAYPTYVIKSIGSKITCMFDLRLGISGCESIKSFSEFQPVDIKDLPEIYKSYPDKDLFKDAILNYTDYINLDDHNPYTSCYILYNNDELLKIQNIEHNERWSIPSRLKNMMYRNVVVDYLIDIKNERVVDPSYELEWFFDKLMNNESVSSKLISKDEVKKYQHIIESHNATMIHDTNNKFTQYINDILSYHAGLNIVLHRNRLLELPKLNTYEKFFLFVKSKDEYEDLLSYTGCDVLTHTARFELYAIEYFEKGSDN